MWGRKGCSDLAGQYGRSQLCGDQGHGSGILCEVGLEKHADLPRRH